MPSHDAPLIHNPDAVLLHGQCALCDNPVPYLREGDTVVHTRVLWPLDGTDPWYVCGDCWETAYQGARLEDVVVSHDVCTIFFTSKAA